jgi:hypothetical protein
MSSYVAWICGDTLDYRAFAFIGLGLGFEGVITGFEA